MGLRLLRIASLRCLESVELTLHPERNYIFGPNGAGKTSILEAAYLLGRGRSFRTRQIRKLVKAGTEGFAVYGEVAGAWGPHRLGVGFGNGRLEKRLDGGPAAMTELAAVLPVHAIEPGLHHLIEGAPSERRRFLDWGVFHVEPRYLESWRQYRRVLGQRNSALKTASPAELLGWTKALAAAGQTIHELRTDYVANLARAVEETGRGLVGERISIEYRGGWSADQPLEVALRDTEATDRAHGATQLGPHRADLRISLDARGVRDEASRGQQKLVATALVLGQIRVHHAANGTQAVVLVDDPAAELDSASLERVLAALDELPAQLIMTALSPAHLRPTPGFPVFHVERGKLQTL